MIRIFFFVFLLLGSASVNGQISDEASQGITPENLMPKHAIKFSPFHLASFYPTIQIAYEFRLRDQLTLQLDGGVMPEIGQNGTKTEVRNHIKNKRGYKLKVEPRYYFQADRFREWVYYGALELYLNHARFDGKSMQTECFDAACQDKYKRAYAYRATYHEPGFALKVGIVHYWYSRIIFDYNVGIGVRFVDYTFPSHIIPENTDWHNTPHMADRVALTPILNFRVGYKIK